MKLIWIVKFVYQSASAICFARQEGATDIQVGDEGFGLMFACYQQNGCEDGTKLGIWFFASYLESLNPPIWHAGVTDYSSVNTGVLYVGNGTDFDTTERLSESYAADLTIPPLGVQPEWRCYFNFLGYEPANRLYL